MFKVTLPLLVTFCCAITLWAQSEPQKSPPIGTTPSGVHGVGKPPAQTNPAHPLEPKPVPNTGDQVATAAVEKNPQPIDATNMDPSVKPQDDFFSYANGGW